jgi:hypothetical protein
LDQIAQTDLRRRRRREPNAERWNITRAGRPGYDLCEKPLRHERNTGFFGNAELKVTILELFGNNGNST